jgi:uncharacterized protein involved in exopolysaccharide biosynthesis
MEEEIDLRAYIEVVLRYWKWIVGLVVAVAVVAFVFNSLLPFTYEAESVVIVTEPRYQIQFDPRFGTEEQSPAYEAFPKLATSDGILQKVADSYTPSAEAGIENWGLETLSRMVKATSGGDPSLVLLMATSRSAKDTAAIANVWADVLVQKGNEIYGGSQKDVLFFEEQLAQAEEALTEAEAALIAFQARNQGSILQAQLESGSQAQADHLGSQRTISYLVQDIRGLREQLAARPEDQSAYLADTLTALLLQIKAFNAQASASETAPITPIQLQIDNLEMLSDKSASEQIDFLDDLVVTLEEKSAEIDTLLAKLEPRILSLQQRLQEAELGQDRLQRAWDLARETYLTMARKVEEARIGAQETTGTLKVGSYAAVPSNPVGPRRLFNTVVAGMLALIVGVIAAFAIEFWRQGGEGVENRGTDDAVVE